MLIAFCVVLLVVEVIGSLVMSAGVYGDTRIVFIMAWICGFFTAVTACVFWLCVLGVS